MPARWVSKQGKMMPISYFCFRIHLLCTYSARSPEYFNIYVRARKIEPPRKKPKFPPNSAIMQVESHAKFSSLYSIALSENAICSDLPDLQFSHSCHFTSYFVVKQLRRQALLLFALRSIRPNSSLPQPLSGSLILSRRFV